MKYLKILSWVLVLAIAVSIYIFSSQPAEQSDSVSKGITEEIVNTMPNTKDLPADAKNDVVKKYNDIIRNYAHFILYLLLGMFLMIAMLLSFPSKKTTLIFLITLAVCLLYSVSDELHQIFVPGRGSQLRDVLTDMLGSFTGTIIIYFTKKLNNAYCKK